MAAAATDLFLKATRRFSTTIGSGGVSDAVVTTVPMTTVTGLPADTGIELTLDRVNSNAALTLDKEEVIRGVVNGLNIINCARGVEGTAQAHAGGAVVEMRLTADQWNRMITGILAQHGQDGLHTGALVTALKATGAEINIGTEDAKIVTPKAIADSNVAMITDIPVKATGAEVTTGTDDAKFVTPKALTDAGIAAGGGAGIDGWNEDTGHTWVYVSASTFKIVGVDLTAVFIPGARIRFKQGAGYKYAAVVAVTFSTDTTVTIAVNTDYTIANATITDNYYSYVIKPLGYPPYFNFTASITNPTGMTGTPSVQFAVFEVVGGWIHLKTMWGCTAGGTISGNAWKLALPRNAIAIAGSPRYVGSGCLERFGAGYSIIVAYADLTKVELRKYNNSAYTTGDDESDIDIWYPYSTT